MNDTTKRALRLASRCYDYGDTLEDIDTIKRSFGEAVADAFRDNYREFEAAPAPLKAPRVHTEAALNTIVQSGLTYGAWLGISGPGAQLRQSIARGNK